MRTMTIEVRGKGNTLAELDERNPRIREAIWQALPIEGRAILWGDEVYFDLPLQLKDENPSLPRRQGTSATGLQVLLFAYSSAGPSPIPGLTTSARWWGVWTCSRGLILRIS